MSNGPEIECLTHRSGLAVTIRSDETYFTVYDSEGKPAGTIHRPRRYSDGMWNVATTDGIPCSQGIGPRTCLNRLASTLAARKEA